MDHLDKDPASVAWIRVMNALFATAEAEGTPNRLLKKEKSATEPQREASRNRSKMPMNSTCSCFDSALWLCVSVATISFSAGC